MSELIRIGDSGELVKQIQTILKEHGFKLTIDGNFGPSTEVAIKEFQHKQNITVDGIVGPKTMELLLLSAGFHPAEAYLNSFNFYSNTPYLIWVSLETNRVNVFRGKNRKWFLANSFLAFIPATPTIKGLYKVGVKSKKIKENRHLFFKWNTYFFENYGFNAISYKEKAINKKLDIEQGGWINLDEEHAKYIFEQIPSGSTVLIS